jgi:hypothetical protein
MMINPTPASKKGPQPKRQRSFDNSFSAPRSLVSPVRVEKYQ